MERSICKASTTRGTPETSMRLFSWPMWPEERLPVRPKGAPTATISSRANEVNPSRASEFRITIDVGAELDGKQLEGLMEEVGRCYVGNTMRNAPKISYEVRAKPS
jgi:hypothetical protein